MAVLHLYLMLCSAHELSLVVHELKPPTFQLSKSEF